LVDVNAQYAGLEYHYTYLIFCGFIVWIIIPGIGLMYGGLARRKSSLSLLFQSLLVASVTTFQWMFWGYSLAYSRTANAFIGDLANFGMRNVQAAPSPSSAVIPEIVFCLYQMLFCACTVQIVIGGSFERGRIVPSLVFGFFWATIVYCRAYNHDLLLRQPLTLEQPSHAGPGTATDGSTNSPRWTSQEEGPCISPPAGQHLHTPLY